MASRGKKENNFLVHGGILAAASIFVRLIGMIYRIPMVNIIGSKGNAYYSSAFSVYNILLLLSSYSLPLSVSKMVSSRMAKGKLRETGRVMTVAMVFALFSGALFGLVTYFGADFFCDRVLNSPASAIALKWMAPTIFLMAVVGVLRGFFQGMETTIPTAVSQVLEQIVNAVVSVLMAYLLFQYGRDLMHRGGDPTLPAAWGAAGGTIGTGMGALTALVFLVFVFFGYRRYFRAGIRQDRSRKIRSYGKLTQILLLTAVPVILSTAANNAIDLVDVAMFNGSMKLRGVSYDAYSAIWGDYNSAYLLLLHLPVSIASAIGVALVPSLSAAYSQGDRKQVLQKAALAVRVTLIISIPCAFGMMAIGGNLAKLLFTSISDESVYYLVAGGMAVVLFSLATVTNAILQGINEMGRPVVHAVLGLLIHTALLALMLYVFHMEIYAVIICYMVFGLVVTVLNLVSIRRLTGYMPDPVRCFLIPGLISLVIVVLCFGVSFVVNHFMSGRLADLVIVLGSLILSLIIYFVGILWSGCLTRKQLKMLPGGDRIVRIGEKLRLIGR